MANGTALMDTLIASLSFLAASCKRSVRQHFSESIAVILELIPVQSLVQLLTISGVSVVAIDVVDWLDCCPENS